MSIENMKKKALATAMYANKFIDKQKIIHVNGYSKFFWIIADKDDNTYYINEHEENDLFLKHPVKKLTASTFNNRKQAVIGEVSYFFEEINNEKVLWLFKLRLLDKNKNDMNLGSQLFDLVEYIAYKEGVNKVMGVAEPIFPFSATIHKLIRFYRYKGCIVERISNDFTKIVDKEKMQLLGKNIINIKSGNRVYRTVTPKRYLSLSPKVSEKEYETEKNCYEISYGDYIRKEPIIILPNKDIEESSKIIFINKPIEKE